MNHQDTKTPREPVPEESIALSYEFLVSRCLGGEKTKTAGGQQ